MSMDEMRAMLDQAGVPRRFQRYQAPICCQPEFRIGMETESRLWPTGVRRLASVVRDGFATVRRETMEATSRAWGNGWRPRVRTSPQEPPTIHHVNRRAPAVTL